MISAAVVLIFLLFNRIHGDVIVYSFSDFPNTGLLSANTLYIVQTPVRLSNQRLVLRGAPGAVLRCNTSPCFTMLSDASFLNVTNVAFEFPNSNSLLARGEITTSGCEREQRFQRFLSNVTVQDWSKLEYLIHSNGANVDSIQLESIGSLGNPVNPDRLMIVTDTSKFAKQITLTRVFTACADPPTILVQPDANTAMFPLLSRIDIVDSMFLGTDFNNDLLLIHLRGLNVSMRNTVTRHMRTDNARFVKIATEDARTVSFTNCTFDQTLLEVEDAANVSLVDSRIVYGRQYSSPVAFRLTRSVTININGVVAQRNGSEPDNVFWFDRVDGGQSELIVTLTVRNANVTDFRRLIATNAGAFSLDSLRIDNVDLRLTSLMQVRVNTTDALITGARAAELERTHLIEIDRMSNVTVRNITVDGVDPAFCVIICNTHYYTNVTIANITVRNSDMSAVARFDYDQQGDAQNVDVRDILVENSRLERGIVCWSRWSRCDVARFTARNVTFKLSLLSLRSSNSSARDCAAENVTFGDGSNALMIPPNFILSGLRLTNVQQRGWLMQSTDWNLARQPMRVELSNVVLVNLTGVDYHGIFNVDTTNGVRHSVELRNWWMQNCSVKYSQAIKFADLNESQITLTNVTAIDVSNEVFHLDRARQVTVRSFNVSRVANRAIYIYNTANVSLTDVTIRGVLICNSDDVVVVSDATNFTASNVAVVDTGAVPTLPCGSPGAALWTQRIDTISIVNSVFERHNGQKSALSIQTANTITIAGTRFDGNRRLDGNAGGALLLMSSWGTASASVVDCFFRNNSALLGGAVQATDVKLSVRGTRFFDNSARNSGAISMAQCCDSEILVVSSLFRNNTASDDTVIRAEVNNFTMIDSDIVGGSVGNVGFNNAQQVLFVRAMMAARMSGVTIANYRFFSTDRPSLTAVLTIAQDTTMTMSNVCLCNNTMLPNNDTTRANATNSVLCYDQSKFEAVDSGSQVQASMPIGTMCQNSFSFTSQWQACPTTCKLRVPELQADPTTTAAPTTTTPATTERLTLAPGEEQSTTSGGSTANATFVTPSTALGSDASVAAPGEDDNVGAIVGGVVGGLIALALLAVCIWFFVIRPRRGESEPSGKELAPTTPTTLVGGAAEVGKEDMTSFRVSDYDRVPAASVASDHVYQSTSAFTKTVVYDRQFAAPSEYESTSSPFGGGPSHQYGAANFLQAGKSKKPLIYLDKIEE
jgi:hypothetical protein